MIFFLPYTVRIVNDVAGIRPRRKIPHGLYSILGVLEADNTKSLAVFLLEKLSQAIKILRGLSTSSFPSTSLTVHYCTFTSKSSNLFLAYELAKFS